jgi:hypothetical protein
VAGRFGRADLRWRARAFVRGLPSDLPRKNCWTIAEHAGDPNPDGMQLLGHPGAAAGALQGLGDQLGLLQDRAQVRPD